MRGGGSGLGFYPPARRLGDVKQVNKPRAFGSNPGMTKTKNINKKAVAGQNSEICDNLWVAVIMVSQVITLVILGWACQVSLLDLPIFGGNEGWFEGWWKAPLFFTPLYLGLAWVLGKAYQKDWEVL